MKELYFSETFSEKGAEDLIYNLSSRKKTAEKSLQRIELKIEFFLKRDLPAVQINKLVSIALFGMQADLNLIPYPLRDKSDGSII